MKFLLPVGGITDHRFGYLTAPNHRGVLAGIAAGNPWAADLGCIDGPEYVKRIDVPAALEWLETMRPYRQTCLFLAGFDVVGDSRATRRAFENHAAAFAGWPLAFVAQDGQEREPLPNPELWQTLFLGGTTAWKLGEGAEACIHRARALGKRIHIGRVNWWKRYQHFASMEGSYEWTCDGTRTRFEHDRALVAWARYMAAPRQPRLFVSTGDCGG